MVISFLKILFELLSISSKPNKGIFVAFNKVIMAWSDK